MRLRGGEGAGYTWILIREILRGKINKRNKNNGKGGKIEWKRNKRGGAGLNKLISDFRKRKKRGGVTPYLYIYNVIFCDNRVLR